MRLSQFLAALAEWCRWRAGLVVLVGIVLALAASGIASRRLGVSTDTDALFAADLPWRQHSIAYDHDFPQFKDMLVVVIDATTPEAAEATAAGLATALAADKANFRAVTRPDGSPYLAANGLLLLDMADLQAVLDRTVDAQPFLGQLVADPSARGLFAALSLLAIGAEQGENLAPFADALRAFHRALDAAAAGHPVPLSWESLLGGGLAEKAGKYRFVQAQVQLDHTALQPAEAASTALRQAAAGLEFVRDGSAHVRLTGSPALADEEFATVAEGAAAGAVGSLALVLLWLVLAVRSWRLILPIVATTALGLLLTTGFAAATIGTLNLISVAFAVLFVGLAVDFAIQFSVRAREQRRVGDGSRFIEHTAAIAGPPILVAAAAAASGFLAFAPTSFRGVAELGIIAGAGMVIAFACTLTFLPAMLALTGPRGGGAEVGLRAGAWLEPRLNRARLPILIGFVVLGALGGVLLPMVHFDSDPLHTKDPTTEAMRTLNDLMNQPLTNPYGADIIAPSLEAADALAERLRKLPAVGQVITLSSFLPTDQPAKLAAIADAAGLLAATLAARETTVPVTAADIRLAAATGLKQINHALPKLSPADPLRAIAADLDRLKDAPDPTLLAANAALTRFLPQQLDRLRTALAAKPVTAADIPPDIARDWKLPDGRARISITPRAEPGDPAGVAAFVAAVRSVAPDAGGAAITIAASADTIVGAFRQAAISALIAIAVLLALVLRRVVDVALVLVSLLLSALLTGLAMALLDMDFNFANIIALPLLQGVGVSFNIYFVMNWRAGHAQFLGTPTARAILFSALTTATAFGSLALSHHPGTASMGKLLLLSLASTLAVTLIFLPVLLRTLMREP